MWFILVTRGRQEENVAKVLEYLGLCCVEEITVPVREVKSVRGGKEIIRKVNLLPKYVFVRAEFNENEFKIISSITGAVGFLKDEKGHPIEVKNPGSWTEKDVNLLDISRHKFHVGMRVFIAKGSFSDNYGNILSLDHTHNRVIVNISVLGRSTPLDLDLGDIEPVK